MKKSIDHYLQTSAIINSGFYRYSWYENSIIFVYTVPFSNIKSQCLTGSFDNFNKVDWILWILKEYSKWIRDYFYYPRRWIIWQELKKIYFYRSRTLIIRNDWHRTTFGKQIYWIISRNFKPCSWLSLEYMNIFVNNIHIIYTKLCGISLLFTDHSLFRISWMNHFLNGLCPAVLCIIHPFPTDHNANRQS